MMPILFSCLACILLRHISCLAALYQEAVNDQTERKGNHQASKNGEPTPDFGLNLILAQDQHDTESECGNDEDQII
ncbi:hypothetical protein D3C77_389490 [compost metagenome]